MTSFGDLLVLNALSDQINRDISRRRHTLAVNNPEFRRYEAAHARQQPDRGIGALGANPIRSYVYPDGSQSFEQTRFTSDGHIEAGVPVDRTPVTGTLDVGPAGATRGAARLVGRAGRPLSKAPKVSPDRTRGIIAYHSSPYKFDTFDFAGHMGKGEGAQMIAHGGYLAQSNKVSGASGPYRLRFAQHDESPNALAYHYRAGKSKEAALKRIDRDISRFRRDLDAGDYSTYPLSLGDPEPFIAASMNNLVEARRIIASGEPLRFPGYTYKTRLRVHPDDLLDWDAPFVGQSLGVQKKLTRLIPGRTLGDRLMGDVPANVNLMRGSEIHKNIAVGLSRGEDIAEKAAAAALQKAGIPGIKYMDGLSRRVGQGTRNIVMFPGTEHLIDILKRYGMIPAATAFGAALLQDHDASQGGI